VRGDGGFDAVGVDIAGGGIDVDKNRRGAHRQNHIARRHPGQRRGDDFIARADAQQLERDLHGDGAGG
jgi:hypothetical protein